MPLRGRTGCGICSPGAAKVSPPTPNKHHATNEDTVTLVIAGRRRPSAGIRFCVGGKIASRPIDVRVVLEANSASNCCLGLVSVEEDERIIIYPGAFLLFVYVTRRKFIEA